LFIDLILQYMICDELFPIRTFDKLHNLQFV